MGRINSSIGLVTGVPIEATVDQLMELAAQPRDRLLERTQKLQDQQVAVTEITSRLLNLQFTTKQLANTDLYSQTQAVSQNEDILSGTVSGSPVTGSYQFTPLRQASAQQLLSTGFAAPDSRIGGGEVTFRQGPRLNEGIGLQLLNGGRGVQRGKIRITDRAGNKADIDLRFATNTQDVVDAINGNADISVKATFEGDRLRITDKTGQDQGRLRIQEVGGGTTAADLGLGRIDVDAASALGEDILSLSERSALSSLNDGLGIQLNRVAPDLEITFQDGSTPLQIDFAAEPEAEGHARATIPTRDVQGGLEFKARATGGDLDGVVIRFETDPEIARGEETVEFTSEDETQELVIRIAEGESTNQDVIRAVRANEEVSELFEVSLETPVQASVPLASSGVSLELMAKPGQLDLESLQLRLEPRDDIIAGKEEIRLDLEAGELTIGIDASRTTAEQLVAAIEADESVSALLEAKLTGEVSAASAELVAADGESTLQIEAIQPGSQLNDIAVRFAARETDSGNVEIIYDNRNPSNQRLTILVPSADTTLADVTAAFADDEAVSQLFTARVGTGNSEAIVDTDVQASTAGGTDTSLAAPDFAATLQPVEALIAPSATATTAGGTPPPVFEETTIGDLLETINAADPERLRAEIRPDGDGLRLIDLTEEGEGTFAVRGLFGSRIVHDLGLGGEAQDGAIEGDKLLSGLGTTFLPSLQGGRGLGTLGTLSLTDRGGNTADVDLSQSRTLEDVIHVINQAGLQLEARVNTIGNGLEIVDFSEQTVSSLIVANTEDGTFTADALGISGESPAGLLATGDLQRQVINGATLLSDLNHGRGVEAGTIIISDSGLTSAFVDLSDERIRTVGDVLDAINTSNSNTFARINDRGDGILLIDQGGGTSTLSVRDFGNTTTAVDLGLARRAETLEVEKTFTQAIDSSSAVTFSLDEDSTLQDLVNQINEEEFGLTASILNEGFGAAPFRLSLISGEEGRKSAFQFDASGIDFDLRETARAQDALIEFGTTAAGQGLLISSPTNEFEDVIDGVTVNVKGTSDSPVALRVEPTHTRLVTTVKTFVDNFNSLHAKIKEHTFFNEANPDESGTLFGSGETLRVESELSALFTRLHFGAGEVQSFQELGIRLKANGELELDTIRLENKIAEDPEAVAEFFTTEEQGLAHKLDQMIEQFAGRDRSLLVSRGSALNDKITFNQDRVKSMNERLERSRLKLLTDFYRMELAVAKLQDSLGAIQAFAPVPPLVNVRG